MTRRTLRGVIRWYGSEHVSHGVWGTATSTRPCTSYRPSRWTSRPPWPPVAMPPHAHGSKPWRSAIRISRTTRASSPMLARATARERGSARALWHRPSSRRCASASVRTSSGHGRHGRHICCSTCGSRPCTTRWRPYAAVGTLLSRTNRMQCGRCSPQLCMHSRLALHGTRPPTCSVHPTEVTVEPA
jgi:hypothetical protein